MCKEFVFLFGNFKVKIHIALLLIPFFLAIVLNGSIDIEKF